MITLASKDYELSKHYDDYEGIITLVSYEELSMHIFSAEWLPVDHLAFHLHPYSCATAQRLAKNMPMNILQYDLHGI